MATFADMTTRNGDNDGPDVVVNVDLARQIRCGVCKYTVTAYPLKGNHSRVLVAEHGHSANRCVASRVVTPVVTA